MNTPPWFPFYPQDWLASMQIATMTTEQEGAYIRLLAFAWTQEDCGVPSDDATLAVITKLNERWNTCSSFVQHVFKQRGNRLFNERLLQERRKYTKLVDKRRKAGIESGRVRRSSNKTKDLDNEHMFNTCSTHVEHIPNHTETETETDKEKDIKNIDSLEPSKPASKQHVEQLNLEIQKPPSNHRVYITYDCVGNPPTWDLVSKQLSEWHRVYGEQCNILQECKKAKAWLDANPNKKKTAKGMKRFLHGWITRGIDRGTCVRPNTPPPDEPEMGQLTDAEITALCKQAGEAHAADVAAGLVDEHYNIIIPEYFELHANDK